MDGFAFLECDFVPVTKKGLTLETVSCLETALVCAIGRHGKIRSNSMVAEANPM